MIIPAMSREVPNVGFDPPCNVSETPGEFKMVSGSETTQISRKKGLRAKDGNVDLKGLPKESGLA